MNKLLTVLLSILSAFVLHAQTYPVSNVWVADLGNGKYKNPILHADYSDPDVCRVGDDYYMTASSFNAIPGLPILHSKDLVNWKIIGHALKRQPPFDVFDKPQHGNGVWAPSIRYHKNEFYIYYPDPDFGIYLIKAKQAAGPWSEPVLVESGKGLIDPCPLWDDFGELYLVHAFAGSRAGIKSIIVVKRLNEEGTSVVDQGKIVYDGHALDPTIEGPKFYKRNGYYYIFAPAGGVATGWQTVLRAKNVYGPYERKVVLSQGATAINGPHQGAWVSTQSGEDWFIHFQDKGAYGRVVHLQPMAWEDDWPVIGEDRDRNGTGEPVLVFRKPDVGKVFDVVSPLESDEFSYQLGPQWQWQANSKGTWAFVDQTSGYLRLYSEKMPAEARNFWDVPNLLLQKFPAEEFSATTSLTFNPNSKLIDERAGIIIMGQSYASLALTSTNAGVNMVFSTCKDASRGNQEDSKVTWAASPVKIYFRVAVTKGAICRFSYSVDGKKFEPVGESFQAEAGKWIGAKVGIFCVRSGQTNDAGYADFDWFRIEK